MSRLTAPAFVLALFALTATAADTEAAGPRHGGPGWGPPSAEDRVAWLNEALELDDQQAAQLLEILQRAEADHRALRERIEAEMKPELCALHDRVSEQVRSILSPEQAARLDQRHQRKAASADRHGRRPPPWSRCDD